MHTSPDLDPQTVLPSTPGGLLLEVSKFSPLRLPQTGPLVCPCVTLNEHKGAEMFSSIFNLAGLVYTKESSSQKFQKENLFVKMTKGRLGEVPYSDSRNRMF